MGVPRDLVERLYTAPPDGFVAARTEAVAGARAAGDAATAREIAKLRRPTVAAWLVNLLALRRPDLMAELVELSGALRAAQRELRGPRLRELSAQRRAVVGALVDQARALAREADPGAAAGKLPMAEVEATLNAALSDVDIAEQVRSGRLIRAATYAGFGEVPRPQLRLITGGPDGVQVAEEPEAVEVEAPEAARAEETARAQRAARAEAARTAQRRSLDRALTEARTRQERAEEELARATAAERDGVAELAELERALAELERRRSAADREVARRKRARRDAERAAVTARRRVGEVEGAVEALTAQEAP
ncbi:hypothetical protein [Plantactinospora sp. CA-290183]|uniref:hypothetical protein n=1 Tax=Plantactinospora sp. CA-290183 TaxID=3240006 RepID=UPI003D941C61